MYIDKPFKLNLLGWNPSLGKILARDGFCALKRTNPRLRNGTKHSIRL